MACGRQCCLWCVFSLRGRRSPSPPTSRPVAWVAQTVSSRIDLIYLGGIAFSRMVEEMEFELTRRAALAPIVVPSSIRTTTYGAGPVVGLEARVRFPARAILIPGVRLHGVGGGAGGGWLVRPSVALGWRF